MPGALAIEQRDHERARLEPRNPRLSVYDLSRPTGPIGASWISISSSGSLSFLPSAELSRALVSRTSDESDFLP